jgi:hypothetical protein
MGSKVQRFKGCILITIRHFANVLYGKTDRFDIPTNLEHGIRQLCGKTNIFYEDFGSSILCLSLTLVCDSTTLESLFRSNWPLRRSEAVLNVEPSYLTPQRWSLFFDQTGRFGGQRQR